MSDLTTTLPPEDLIFLVAGHRDRALFDATRRAGAQTLVNLLADVGISIFSRRSILDFGCGCGRMLAGLEGFLAPNSRLYGCDLNAALAGFCQKNIAFAEVAQTGPMPPLPYPDRFFDLIYATSVYTHMTLPQMLQWTGEIARILQPGGIAVITHSGSAYDAQLTELSPEGMQQVRDRGYYVHLHTAPANTWAGSNDYATWATPTFMNRLFAGFERVGFVPGQSPKLVAFAHIQDVSIFRRLED